MHETIEKVLKVSQTDLTFEKIYNKDYFPNSIPKIKEANMLLIPNENLRENTGITFPETTIEFYEFLKEKANDSFKPDIAISDENFKKINMHSALVPLATIICTIVIVPMVVNLVSAFLYDLAFHYLRKKEELAADVNLIIQDENGKSLRLHYKGPVSGIKETLNNGVAQAFEEFFTVKYGGKELSLKSSASIDNSPSIPAEKEVNE